MIELKYNFIELSVVDMSVYLIKKKKLFYALKNIIYPIEIKMFRIL